MNIFSEVKEHLTARQAAEYYGLKVKRNGTACCPFQPYMNVRTAPDALTRRNVRSPKITRSFMCRKVLLRRGRNRIGTSIVRPELSTA